MAEKKSILENALLILKYPKMHNANTKEILRSVAREKLIVW
jgi:hypothetical protein